MKIFIFLLILYLSLMSPKLDAQELKYRWTGLQQFHSGPDMTVGSNFSTLQHLSISVWIKTELYSGAYQAIISKQPSGLCSITHSATTSNHSGLFTLMLTDNNQIYFTSQRESGCNSWGYVTPNQVAIGKWQHIAVTVNKSNNIMKIYSVHDKNKSSIGSIAK